MSKFYAVAPLRIFVPYLTPGKRYRIVDGISIDDEFRIICDNGEEINCVLDECNHLHGLDWGVVMVEENVNDN